MNAASPHRHGSPRGFALGLGAYALWGVLPIYFKAIAAVSAVDIVAHRVLWSLPFLSVLIVASRGWAKVRAAATRPRTLGLLAVTALLIAGNWLLYVYAVTSGHILAASFGYYLNPLANVLLGRFVLKERLNRLQWTAVAIAAAGITVLAAGALGQLWISLTLCVSFALYGLLSKIVSADAVTGLGIETALLFPWAMAWLAWRTVAGRRRWARATQTPGCWSSPESSRPRRCCCSPPPRGGWLIRPLECCSSSPRRCSS